MSVRILQGDTVESVKHYLESIMPCDVQVKATFAEDPKPAGSVESEAYHLMSETIYDIFGKETLIVPNLMLGRLTLEITRRYRIMSSVSAAA